ncbi:MAG: GNAT family N-acetyltransferase [SAR86 cluster bacterium]|uniref:GNAT family N-acetyltransferase n=1 Tax=SAR86 cluster bacterium TaxID=2030880 RepID=A0A2A4XJI1_9GAMM|nr:MAG: GNAT family N-acetyltransferase [SAR86 cluster bacterium]
MQVKIAATLEELKLISPVLLQLRPQYSEGTLVTQIQSQQADGYHVAYVEDGENILSVAGFVMSQKLAWKKHIYVDDLVTNEAHRSTGAGKFLIDWLKQFGRDNGCQQLHLDSGVTRFGAHRFYLREGFDITSHHFAVVELNDN